MYAKDDVFLLSRKQLEIHHLFLVVLFNFIIALSDV